MEADTSTDIAITITITIVIVIAISITASTATSTRRAHTPINVNIPAGQLQRCTEKKDQYLLTNIPKAHTYELQYSGIFLTKIVVSTLAQS